MRKGVLFRLVVLVFSVGGAAAADLTTKVRNPVPALPSWWDTVTITGHVQAGITFNEGPSGGTNFGHLFTDKANSPLMNQALLTVPVRSIPKRADTISASSSRRCTARMHGTRTFWVSSISRSAVAISLTSSRPTLCFICRGSPRAAWMSRSNNT